jgi:hypothetical protein
MAEFLTDINSLPMLRPLNPLKMATVGDELFITADFFLLAL